MTHQKKEKLYFFTPLIVVLFPTFPNNFSMGVQFLFVLEMVLMILFYIMGLYRLSKESYGVQITCYFFFATNRGSPVCYFLSSLYLQKTAMQVRHVICARHTFMQRFYCCHYLSTCPPSMSSSSVVMLCWRNLLYSSCNSSSNFCALSLAVCIAMTRAAASEALFSVHTSCITELM